MSTDYAQKAAELKSILNEQVNIAHQLSKKISEISNELENTTEINSEEELKQYYAKYYTQQYLGETVDRILSDTEEIENQYWINMTLLAMQDKASYIN